LALYFLPFVLALKAPHLGNFDRFSLPLSDTLGFFAWSNALDLMVASVFFLFALLMLLHRIAWPVMERPVYALYRYKVFVEQKKTVLFVGLALLGFATNKSLKLIEAVKSIFS
jgi:hypothetical protein